ncbi:hypothetical protein FR932_03825 [Moritella marina ATCC 15381]|uniref:Uncharacterized protein n=1 Tax=Moritella marina ATCC 15381 TaxID=1202962 RepID=A0A5J6WIF6_MORMI|nr:hypothetical protein [Moritella marina]QFI37018.1 hypothetical protein FR932_03825 [Moritella marina ATCC 15381]
MSKSIRTLSLNEVTIMLKSDEFIVIDPIASEAYIYDYDINGHFEKVFVFLAEDVIPTLEKWSESQLIANRSFNEKPCGYCYAGWNISADGERHYAVKQQAVALGLS